MLDNCYSLCDSLLGEDLLSDCQHEALALPHQQCPLGPAVVVPSCVALKKHLLSSLHSQ